MNLFEKIVAWYPQYSVEYCTYMVKKNTDGSSEILYSDCLIKILNKNSNGNINIVVNLEK